MDFIKFVPPGTWGNDFPAIAAAINSQATAAGIPACALAAIVMRESNGLNVFQNGMPHDSPDCGYGYCQITYGADRTDPEHPVYHLNGHTYALFDADGNLCVAAQGFLAPAITSMLKLRDAHSGAMPQQILYYAFAAYNAGIGAVTNTILGGGNVDGTTTDNYGSATLALYNTAVAASHAKALAPA